MDLLCVFPNRYIDRTRFYKVSELPQSQADVQVIGKISHIETITKGRHKRLVATFGDETGQMELVWFRGIKWIQKNLKTNTFLSFLTTFWLPYMLPGSIFSPYDADPENYADPDPQPWF